MFPYLLLSAFLVILDQVTKALATAKLAPLGSVPIIDGVFHLTYAQNTGAAFSLFRGGRWFFVVLTSVVIIALGYLMYKKFFPTVLSRVAVAVILGGTLGNFIDRARFGYVVDMFDFRLINFAIFNVADACLTIGIVLFAIYAFTDDFLKKLGGQNEK